MKKSEMVSNAMGCNISVAENEHKDIDNMFKCQLGKEYIHFGFMEDDNNKLVSIVTHKIFDSSPQDSFCEIYNGYHNAIATAGSEFSDCVIFNFSYGINLLSWFCKFYTEKLNETDSKERDITINRALQHHIKTFKSNHRQFYDVFNIYVNNEVLRKNFYDTKFDLAFDKIEEFLSQIDRELN